MPSDGFRCDVCGDVHDTRADALRCCSDGFDDDDGLDPDDRLAMNAVDGHGAPTVITDGGRVIEETAPAGPEDLAAVDQGDEIVLEFSTVNGHGTESIRGPACHVHESDTAVTVTVRDLSRGIFDLILPETDDGHVLDAGIEGQTHAAGYLVKDIDEIETLEIHEVVTDGSGLRNETYLGVDDLLELAQEHAEDCDVIYHIRQVRSLHNVRGGDRDV